MTPKQPAFWTNFYTDRRYRGVEDSEGRMMFAWQSPLYETLEDAQAVRDEIRNAYEQHTDCERLREAAKLAREALSINDSVPDAESWAYYCPWCNAELGWAEHKAGAAMPHLPTCPRQLALATLDATLSTPTAPLIDLSAVSGDV